MGGLLVEGWNKGWETWLKGAEFSFLEPYPDFDLEAVARYATEKGVALIGHHETGGNIAGYEKERDQAFALYERLGVHAIKTGYAGTLVPSNQHRHGQWMVRHYREVVKRAAAHRIAIDAHEPVKPTGIRRTYPNMMTREGVRGMEYNAWSDGNPPEHTTILPFTRMLAGPLDYTPGIFDLTFNRYKPNHRVYSTLANQLALYVVLFSPLQMVADLPENYERHPAFGFIKAVPTTWDETRVPHAEIGDYVVVVRRQGEAWFLGAVTDEEARELEVPLDFLAAGQTYTAHIYADGDKAHWERNPTAFERKERMVGREETLTLSLAAGGGQAIWFEKVQEIPASNGR
jgi:alpha-glucosidase